MTDRRGPLVVGVDASTSACKALAWDPEGRCVAEGRAPLALHNPAPDAWEQDAEQWWTALGHAVRALVAALGPRAPAVAGLAIAHQRETFVVTDPDGRPLHPALVWMDARCRPEVTRLVARFGFDPLHRLTGKPPCTTPSLYKLAFLMDRGAPALGQALRAGQARVHEVHGFLVERLTGERVTSLAAADPLGLTAPGTGDYCDALLEALGLSRAVLPTLRPPGARLGPLTEAAAEALGLPRGLPVVAGAGDGQAAGLGAGVLAGPRAYLNLGTAVVSGILSREPSVDRGYRTLAGALPGTFFLETDLKGGTFTLEWLLRVLGAGDAATALPGLEAEAARLPPGAEGLLLLPYWNGVMNPYWDDRAAGALIGLTGSHGRGHLLRALYEGIALEQRLHGAALEQALGGPLAEYVVLGGGSRSALWCQLMASITGRRVVRAGEAEATALGAGILAALGVGWFPDAAAAVAAMTRTGEAFEPDASAAFYDRWFDEAYRPLYPALAATFARAGALASPCQSVTATE